MLIHTHILTERVMGLWFYYLLFFITEGVMVLLSFIFLIKDIVKSFHFKC